MVKINKRFEFERDSKCWLLYEWKDGINSKTKDPTRNRTICYYTDLIHVLNAIIDRSCDAADNVTTIIDIILKTRKEIVVALYGYELPDDALGYKVYCFDKYGDIVSKGRQIMVPAKEKK